MSRRALTTAGRASRVTGVWKPPFAFLMLAAFIAALVLNAAAQTGGTP